jgi:hypothetical protein
MWWWSSKNKNSESDSEREDNDSQVDSAHPAAAALLELQRASGNKAVRHAVGADESRANAESSQPLVDSLSEPSADLKGAGIRLHTDDDASKSAASLGAAAYTRGRDIYFGAGKYAPQTSDGKRLLAHEIAHALRNEPGPEVSRAMPGDQVIDEDDPSERDAESFAESDSHHLGHPSLSPSAHSRAIHRAPLTEAEIAQKLHDAMASFATDEAEIINLLSTLNRDAAKLKKVRDAYSASFKTDLETDIRAEMSGEELAHALFLLNAPPPAVAAADTTVDKIGTEKLKEKVADGEISVHTDVQYTSGVTYTGGYSVGYKGGKASESHILQFIWSEILATKPDGTVDHLADTGLPVTGAVTMDLSPNPATPKYKVDNGGGSTPFYESGGTDIRTATSTTIYDRPSEFKNIITKQFDKGATKVVEVDHFEDFLVREYKTIYRVSITVTWVYTSKTSMTRTTDFKSGTAVTGLPSDIKKQLVKEYPKFDYIQ